MKINIRNHAGIPNKYIRYAKWKVRKINEKFDNILYVEIHISKEGSSLVEYESVIKLGVPGNDIVITTRSSDLTKLWKDSLNRALRQMRRYKEKRHSLKQAS